MEPKEHIRIVRKRLRLSQKAFGEAFGKSRDVIANYENGRVTPPEDFLRKLKGLDKRTKRFKPLDEIITNTLSV